MAERPNILFILSDDHGAWAMHCAGNDEIITPNLDRIAADGMRFENFFCASPVCSPARISLFTGKIPSQHGVHDWLAKGHADYNQLDADLKAHMAEEKPPWEYEWPKDQLSEDHGIRYLEGHTTFTEVLRDNGYTCALSGKWHMGDAGHPQAGFTWWRTQAMGGENYKYPVVLKDGSFSMLKGKYITQYITENAINFLKNDAPKDHPFYLSVHYTAPHAPWGKEHHEQEIYELYDDCPFASVPDVPNHPWSDVAYMTEEQRVKYRHDSLQGYYAAVTSMDKYIGQILDTLEEEGLRDNTLVIFTGDNGMSMGHHGIFGKGNGTRPMNMYDSAVKVPFLISWPGHIPSGKVENGLYSHYDVFQTLVDYLQLPYECPPGLAGVSFAPVLRGQSMKGREHVIIMDEYGPVRMIRTPEWKYVHRYLDWEGQNELYDLVNDPGEEENLADLPESAMMEETLRNALINWYLGKVDSRYDGSLAYDYGIGQTGLYNAKEDTRTFFRQPEEQ